MPAKRTRRPDRRQHRTGTGNQEKIMCCCVASSQVPKQKLNLFANHDSIRNSNNNFNQQTHGGCGIYLLVDSMPHTCSLVSLTQRFDSICATHFTLNCRVKVQISESINQPFRPPPPTRTHTRTHTHFPPPHTTTTAAAANVHKQTTPTAPTCPSELQQ